MIFFIYSISILLVHKLQKTKYLFYINEIYNKKNF